MPSQASDPLLASAVVVPVAPMVERVNRASLVSLPGLVVVLATMCAGGCSHPAPPPPGPLQIPVVNVIRRDVPVSQQWLGETVGSVNVQVVARVEGYLEGIHFDEGTIVKQGQLLYTIDARPLRAQVDQARGQLQAVQAQHNTAVSSSRRYEALVGSGAVSTEERDQAVGAAQQAAGQTQAAKASLQQARIDLGYSRIRSPVTGLIGRSQVKVGDLVGPGNAMLLDTVSTIDPIDVRFSIPESDYLALARSGILKPTVAGSGAEHAAVAVDAPPPILHLVLADGSAYPHPGVVRFADRALDPTTGSLVVEGRVPNPDGLLRPGQFVRVSAVVRTRHGALLVPQRCVQQLQDQYHVMVVGKGGQVEQRAVTPGPRVGDLWVIDHGLEGGERVVYEGLQKVRPGQKVEPKVVPVPSEASRDGGT